MHGYVGGVGLVLRKNSNVERFGVSPDFCWRPVALDPEPIRSPLDAWDEGLDSIDLDRSIGEMHDGDDKALGHGP
jgi:hypothetical protein